MLVTQCPDCHSLFRVTQGQLKLADGKVRCGACFIVFDAFDHALHKQQPQEQADTQPNQHIEQVTENRTVSEAVGESRRLTESADSPDSHSDTRSQTQAKTTDPNPRPGSAKILPFSHPSAPEVVQPDQASERQDDSLPSDKAFDIPMLEIRAEPIILSVDSEVEQNPVAVLTLALAGFVALMLLAGQYLWFERARLANTVQLTPLYTLACDHLPCALSGTDGLKTLTTDRVVVRPHPLFADLVSLSIRINNESRFVQPYPAIEVSFINLKGELITRRTFEPSEYATELPSPSQLAPGLDLEVDIPLTDPGISAVSYEVQLRESRS